MAKKMSARQKYQAQGEDYLTDAKAAIEELGVAGSAVENIFKSLGSELVAGRVQSEKSLKAWKEGVDVAKEVLSNRKEVTKVEHENYSWADKIKKTTSASGKETLKFLKEEQSLQKQVKKEIKGKVKSQKQGFEDLKSGVEKIPLIGDMLGSGLDAAKPFFDKYLESFEGAANQGLAEGGLKGAEEMSKKAMFKGVSIGIGTAVLTGLVAYGKKAFDVMREMGIGLGQALSHPELIIFAEESKAIAEEFGNINEASMQLGAQMKWTAYFSGVTAENQAKIMGAMAATSSSSLENLQSQMMATKELTKAAGIPFAAVMEDVAENTKLFAEFAKDGGKNIMLAAVEAKKMGVSLSEVASISESLLNFEDSIAAQMEASMLLGREINLDRARQLNFAGDQVGMLKEINAQVGSEAEFNKMNVLARRSLAAAVGLSTEELGNLIREEETAGKAAAGIKWAWIGIGAAIGAIIGMIIGGLTMGTGLPAMFGGMAAGAAGGAGIGAGIGTLGALGGAAIASFQGLPVGTGVNIQGGAALAHAGETIVRTESINMDDTNTILIEGFDRMRKEYRNTQNG